MKRLFSLCLVSLLCVLFPLTSKAQTIITSDDSDTSGVYYTGTWTKVTSGTGHYGSSFRHDNNGGKGSKQVLFQPILTTPGLYEVYGYWKANTDRSTAVPIEIGMVGGARNVFVNQQNNGSQWSYLAEGQFLAGSTNLIVRNTGTTGTIVADAFQWRLKKPAPMMPGGLRAIPSNGTVTVQWNPVTDSTSPATSYRVYHTTTVGNFGPVYNGSDEVAGTSLTLRGLTNGTRYYFSVRSVNNAGMSGFSASVETIPQAPPSAPEGLTATPGDGSAKLAWSALSGATGYEIFRGTTSNAYGSTPLASVGIGTPAYTDSGLANGTTYYYVVRGVNGAVPGPNSNQVSTIPVSTSGAPTNLTAMPLDSRVTLSWSPVAGASSYKIFRTIAGSGFDYTLSSGTTSSTSYTVPGLTNGTHYYFVVRSVNTGGISGDSNQANAIPKVSPPPLPPPPPVGVVVPKPWRALDVATASDNTSRLMWLTPEGQYVFWHLNVSGVRTKASVLHGPIAGWTPVALKVGGDGLTRVLLSRSDGAAAVWTLNADMNLAAPGFSSALYGPEAGWSAIDLAVASDNSQRILWRHTNGAMRLWIVSPTGAVNTAAPHGPFSGWTPRSIAVGSDGKTRVLWFNPSVGTSIWVVDATGRHEGTYPTYAINGDWQPIDIALDTGAGSDNKFRLMWKHSNGTVSLTRLSLDGTVFEVNAQHGPYYGWTPTALAVGGDGNMSVLWLHEGGRADFWRLSPDGWGRPVLTAHGPLPEPGDGAPQAPSVVGSSFDSISLRAPALPQGATSLALQQKQIYEENGVETGEENGVETGLFVLVTNNLTADTLSTVGSLAPAQSYLFRYVAVNAQGVETPGPEIRWRAPSIVPPDIAWSADQNINCAGIRWPFNGATVQGRGIQTRLSAFLATDWDQKSEDGSIMPLAFSDPCSYTWTATTSAGAAAGSFPQGNVGQGVIWISPTTPGTYTLTLTVDDQNGVNIGTGDRLQRDDAARGFNDPAQTFRINVTVP